MATLQKLSDKRWRIAGTVAAVAATTTAGGVAWAATNADPTPSPSPSASPSAPSNQPGPGKGLGHRGEFGMGGALHGEFVVPKDGGGYQTVATQRGEVTAVSKDSITVKSEDGYSRTYTLTEDTLVNAARDGIDDVKVGNTVQVTAVVADGKATASSVNDGTVRKAAGDKWGFKRGPR
ncbi:hypothetical protein E0H75_22790 [Kribbella capetownensis]|uniref:DUF5666 domain-containing protein n=1 Tax=Kribbella capetownensis TaxID=1572659 RepID=A0A4R0JMI9_9ACTN|nr:hypothetical protein [Kribbella capetownensis]TCC47597.1 hypothetical protein E0H75_22790 [Kribbella capetownensis]